MANTFNAATAAKIQTMVNNLTTSLGNGVTLNFLNSQGFVLNLRFETDHVTVEAWPTDQGSSLKPVKILVENLP